MQKDIKTEIIEWIKAIVFALILALIIRGFIFEPMIVPTGSMIPTIEINDRIWSISLYIDSKLRIITI
jgi:signal peptidase I